MQDKSLLTRREWLAATSGLAAGSAARGSQAAAPGGGATQLDQLFQNPPLSARPSCYWLWLNDYTDKDQLTRELDEFKAKGLSGGYIFDIGARDPEGIVPVGPAYLSDESLAAIAHVTREATRRGMELGIVTSSSWNSGGPWVTPEHAGKGLYLSQTTIAGPGKKTIELPMPGFPGKAPLGPDGLPLYWKDVAILAVPEKRAPGHEFLIELAAPLTQPVDRVALYNTESEDPQRDGPHHLFAKDFAVYVSGTTTEPQAFREVLRASLEPRTGRQEFRIGPVNARYVKLVILSGHNAEQDRVELAEFQVLTADGTNVAARRRPGGGAELLHFSTQFGHESLGEPPDWTARNIHDGVTSGSRGSWSSSGPPPVLVEDVADVVDLTEKVNGSRLEWDVPAGRWAILRFVSAVTGQQMVLPSPNSQGLTIDHFSAGATRMHIRYICDKLREKLGRLDQTAMKQVYSASYELRGSIWTPDFLEQFRRRRGYDMLPYLPALFGSEVGSGEIAERFRYDHNKTLGELLVDGYYRTGTETAHEYGLQFAAEAGGPGPPLHQVPVDALQAQGAVDIPRGEFWKGNDIWVVKETACAAHIYGKRIVQMESFTSFRHWLEGPFDLKDIADRSFCEGANHHVFHTTAHHPPGAPLPGWVYHAGTQFSPTLVWWPMAGSFVKYLSRCSALLQQGLFVADVCYYYGDQGFNFVPPKHVDPSLGPGYDYDVVNAEVILNRMSVQNDRITFPDGMSYALLVLPERDDIDLAVLEKLEQLVREGATVVGPKPGRATGLTDYPRRDQTVQQLAGKMWGACDGQTVKENRYGRGTIVWGRSLRDVLGERNIGPDFAYDSGKGFDLDFIHRRTGDADIYYVWNRRLEWQEPVCRFRVQNRAPEIWDPVTGEKNEPAVFSAQDGAVSLPLRLAPGGGLFVLFRKDAGREYLTSLEAVGAGPQSEVVRSGEFPALELRRDNSHVQARGFVAGRYSCHTNRGRTLTVEIPSVPAPRTIEGPWDIQFPENWGAPASARFDELISWTESPTEGIKYFSGIATYIKDFDLAAELLGKGKHLYLDLGRVRVAGNVRLNGRPIGIVWATPYRLDITSAAKPGSNHLVVEVANTWANRLTGDLRLPKDQRYTGTNIDWARRSGAPQPPLLESGLLGPVRLISGLDKTILENA